MSAKVIQGWFLSGQPKLTALVQSRMLAPSPIQTKVATRPPGPPVPAFAARVAPPIQTKPSMRPPGPPAPAFGGRAATVQRHGAGGAFAVEAGPLGLASGGGKPLPDAVRGKMEAALRADFSNVRVHTGPQAERIGAIAFTTGNDIYFAPGRYQPNTLQGQQLLGHELAHVVQQRAGRVRNPLGSGLAVVQDRALEAEADRMGQRAAAHRVAVQAKMPPAGAGREMPERVPSVGAGPGTIQRTIWRFDHGKWVVAELGTKGGWRPGPAISRQGQYFNDISGETGRSIEEVRAGVADLLLMSGSLGELPKAVPWPDDVWKGLNQSAMAQVGEDGGHIVVGRVTLAPGYAPSFEEVAVGKPLLQNTWNNFLKQFMEANGQLPYIRRQKWFTQHKANVIVEINFYYNRLPNEAFRFHKDTGGDNLFVNLVFNNKDKMLATEWIEDLKSDAMGKKKALRRNLPAGQREELDDARSAFRRQRNPYRLEDQGGVRGGVVGSAAYVSWVDELVWHSTPAPLSRTGYYKAILTPENYWKYKPYAIEAIRVLYRNRKQIMAFNYFCGRNFAKDETNQITTRLCDEYMTAVGTYPYWRNLHLTGIEAFAGLSLTDLKPINKGRGPQMERGVDLDADELALTHKMENKMKDTGIRPEIRRRNSFANPNFSISTEKRSFVRTWVRVHRRDVRSALEERQERLNNGDRYFEALDFAVDPRGADRGHSLPYHQKAGLIFTTT